MKNEDGKSRKDTPSPEGALLPGEHESLPPIVSAAIEEPGFSLLSRLYRLAAANPGAERYTILGEIGQGGMGRVLRVWDNDLSRELAMKEVPAEPPAGGSDEESASHRQRLERFIDEARITGRLDHPGIVPVHEISIDGTGRLFFTMPLLRGRNFAEVLEHVRSEEENWNRTRALHVLLNVCMTVAFAHSKGVVHRDLKPSNIMVGKFGEAYVVDWGLALILGRSEQRRIVGTPAYMSPEQAEARSEDVGPRSDVYSLGAILYELLTGRMPHELSLEQRTGNLEAVIGAVPRPVSKVAVDVPGELAAICEKAMARNPEDRYASAYLLAEDLRAFLEDRVVETFDASRMARLRKWRRRNRKLAHALEALVVVGLLGTALVFFTAWRGEREVRAEQTNAFRSAYTKNIRAAAEFLSQGNAFDARQTLPEYDPSVSGWEWDHLEFALDSSSFTLRAHDGAEISHVAYTPEADTFLSAAPDRKLHLWDAATGTLRRTFEAHEKEITCVAIDPRRRYLASGDEDNRVLLWDISTAAIVRELGAKELNVISICFSPGGERVTWCDAQGIHVRRVPSGDVLADVATVADGHALWVIPGREEDRLTAVHADNTLRVWEIREGTGRELRRVELVPSSVMAVAHHAGASLLAVGGKFNRVLVLDLDTWATRSTLSLGDSSPTALGFNAEGSRLFVGTNKGILETWDVGARRLVCRQYGHRGSITSVACHPDGTRLLTSSLDGTVRFWSPEGGAERVLQLPSGRVFCLTFSRDGRTICCGSVGDKVENPLLRTWDAYTGDLRQTMPTPGVVDDIAFHPRADQFAYVANEGSVSHPSSIFLRRRAEGEAVRELPGHEGFVRAIAYDADGDRLLSRSVDGTIRLWDVATGQQLVVLEGIDDNNDSIAVDPRSGQFAYGSTDGAIHVCAIDDGRTLRTLRWSASIQSLAFSPDGRLLAAGTLEGNIVLWLRDDDAPPTTLSDPDSLITSFAFAPDGTRIVSGSAKGSVRLWDVERHELLMTLRGHADQVTAVAFSPEGDRIASASFDGQVRLWRNSARPRDDTHDGDD